MVTRHPQRGLAYLWLLFLLTLITLGIGRSLDWYSTVNQRQKERQLLWVGQQYVQAIRSYYQSSPGTQKRYPPTLEDLLEDKRFVTMRRHLRRLYRDPMTGQPGWTLIMAPEGGVMGVASPSARETWKQSGFPAMLAALAGKQRYNEWQFVYVPPATPIK